MIDTLVIFLSHPCKPETNATVINVSNPLNILHTGQFYNAIAEI